MTTAQDPSFVASAAACGATYGHAFDPAYHTTRVVRGTRRVRGLTLIELAIALAVLAVVCALAVPSLGARLQHQRVLGTAQALAADVSDARFEAAQRGSTVQLQTRSGKTSTDWCWAVTIGAGCGCSPNPAPRTACQLRNVPASEHAGVMLTDGANADIEPTGSRGNGNRLQLATLASAKGDTLRVEVSATGRPRVCSVSGNWPGVVAC